MVWFVLYCNNELTKDCYFFNKSNFAFFASCLKEELSGTF